MQHKWAVNAVCAHAVNGRAVCRGAVQGYQWASLVSVLEPVPHCGLGKTRQRDPHTGHSAADYVTSGASDCEERIVPPES